MSEKFRAVFLVVAPESNPETDRNLIETPCVDLLTVMTKDYEQAASVAKELLAEGYGAIELCAGFGNKGVQMVSEAVDYKIPVGVVRFDNHPGLGNQSGDELFM